MRRYFNIFIAQILDLFTGSIVHGSKWQYWNYSEGNFGVLHPTGATCQINMGYIWHLACHISTQSCRNRGM